MPAGESSEVGGKGGEGKAYGVASEPSKVRGDGGGCEASRVAENPRGNPQGVGRRFKSPQVINTPGVDALPRGDETPGVATKGNRVTGEDGWGWGGDGTPPTTQASKESVADVRNDGMARGPRTAEPPRL